MLVSFFRKPVLAKVVGTVAALAFLLPLIRYEQGLKIALPLAVGLVIFLLIRGYLLRRRRRLTLPEEDYLKKRFYLH